jgi:alpha-ketoglutarate-dependent taurine dioxygenase
MNESGRPPADEDFARFSFLEPSQRMPLVIEPGHTEMDHFAWVADHRTPVEKKLLLHGAVLFRNFAIHSNEDFRSFIDPLVDEVMRHPEMVSGRQEVGNGVYTPTRYPPDRQIAPHNEHSASLTFPGKLAFWCQLPAAHDGETPIIDTRNVYKRIDPRVRDKFERLGWMWVRNYDHLAGRGWQAAFQTDSRSEVESYCDKNGILYEWKSDNELRTRRVRPAVIQHPVTGDFSWFNHITFFHISTLPSDIQALVRSTYREADFPNNTYYGDGSPIEDEIVTNLREAYRLETVSFRWQKGDVLLIDNILTAHARNSFSGQRQILLILANPVTRSDIGSNP